MIRLKPAILVFVAIILIASGSAGGTHVAAQDDAEEPILVYEELALIPEVTSSTDEFGRAPFFRLTFEALAGIGPEDLSPPFVGYVESGVITFQHASRSIEELGVGSRVEIATADDFSLRNLQDFGRATMLILAQPGSCRVYADNACMPLFLPYDFLCDAPCRPDVTNTLLFERQFVMDRLWVLNMSVALLRMPANHIAESVDFGGEGSVKRLQVRVMTGSLVTNNGDAFTAGDEFDADADDVIIAGDEGTEILVLRISNPEEA